MFSLEYVWTVYDCIRLLDHNTPVVKMHCLSLKSPYVRSDEISYLKVNTEDGKEQ